MGVIEWDGTQSDDGGGAGGVALGWVFAVEGGTRVRVHWDGRGVMQGGQNESGWVGIGESLTEAKSDPGTLSCPEWVCVRECLQVRCVS